MEDIIIVDGGYIVGENKWNCPCIQVTVGELLGHAKATVGQLLGHANVTVWD